jgi:hypothetical protein
VQLAVGDVVDGDIADVGPVLGGDRGNDAELFDRKLRQRGG